MPGGDRTGPWGAGPMTGRGVGICAGYDMPGYMNPAFGRGSGRGWGRGFGRGSGMGAAGDGVISITRQDCQDGSAAVDMLIRLTIRADVKAFLPAQLQPRKKLDLGSSQI